MEQAAPKYYSSSGEEAKWRAHLEALLDLPPEPEEDKEEEFFVL